MPEVILTFWIIKILATALGETGGDTLSMTFNLGYLVSTGIFAAAMLAFVIIQIRARGFHPFLYWATIIASTTLGTTLADFADRSLGIGYPGGSLLLLALMGVSLGLWYWKVRYPLRRCALGVSKPSTSSPSHFRKPLAPRWVIGPPTAG